MNDQEMKKKHENEKQEKPRYKSETEERGQHKQASPSTGDTEKEETRKEPMKERKSMKTLLLLILATPLMISAYSSNNRVTDINGRVKDMDDMKTMKDEQLELKDQKPYNEVKIEASEKQEASTEESKKDNAVDQYKY